jgi:hypothetical protein
MSSQEAYERLLRVDAEKFALTVAVYAWSVGRDPRIVALDELTNALARLSEAGVLGSAVNDDDEGEA